MRVPVTSIKTLGAWLEKRGCRDVKYTPDNRAWSVELGSNSTNVQADIVLEGVTFCVESDLFVFVGDITGLAAFLDIVRYGAIIDALLEAKGFVATQIQMRHDSKQLIAVIGEEGYVWNGQYFTDERTGKPFQPPTDGLPRYADDEGTDTPMKKRSASTLVQDDKDFVNIVAEQTNTTADIAIEALDENKWDAVSAVLALTSKNEKGWFSSWGDNDGVLIVVEPNDPLYTQFLEKCEFKKHTKTMTAYELGMTVEKKALAWVGRLYVSKSLAANITGGANVRGFATPADLINLLAASARRGKLRK
jgi:NACalpha-BTF3-like transcription factor